MNLTSNFIKRKVTAQKNLDVFSKLAIKSAMRRRNINRKLSKDEAASIIQIFYRKKLLRKVSAIRKI